MNHKRIYEKAQKYHFPGRISKQFYFILKKSDNELEFQIKSSEKQLYSYYFFSVVDFN